MKLFRICLFQIFTPIILFAQKIDNINLIDSWKQINLTDSFGVWKFEQNGVLTMDHGSGGPIAQFSFIIDSSENRKTLIAENNQKTSKYFYRIISGNSDSLILVYYKFALLDKDLKKWKESNMIRHSLAFRFVRIKAGK